MNFILFTSGLHIVSITAGISVPLLSTLSVCRINKQRSAFSLGNWSVNIFHAVTTSPGFLRRIFLLFQKTTKSYSLFSKNLSLNTSNSKSFAIGKNFFSSIPCGVYCTCQSFLGNL